MSALALLVALAAWPGLAAADDLIQVDVQVLEVNQGKLHKIGLDWTRLLEGAPGAVPPVSPAEALEQAGPPLGKLGTFQRGQVDAFLRLMQANNYGKLLAKPKLLTISGMPASFLVGGELPIVSQDTQGQGCVPFLT